MLLVIRDQHKEYNRFEGVYALESFICNITAKAAGKNLKMKVNDNMNGFATFIFYQSNGIVYEFRNVPYSYGYITEAGIDQIIKAGK